MIFFLRGLSGWIAFAAGSYWQGPRSAATRFLRISRRPMPRSPPGDAVYNETRRAPRRGCRRWGSLLKIDAQRGFEIGRSLRPTNADAWINNETISVRQVARILSAIMPVGIGAVATYRPQIRATSRTSSRVGAAATNHMIVLDADSLIRMHRR